MRSLHPFSIVTNLDRIILIGSQPVSAASAAVFRIMFGLLGICQGRRENVPERHGQRILLLGNGELIYDGPPDNVIYSLMERFTVSKAG